MFGVPIDFMLFGLTLLGVAIFHHHTLEVAVSGLAAITVYKTLFSPFPTGPGLPGLTAHLSHEWVIVANLACLLLGFALLARHFEKSHAPLALPRLLPDDWKGCFALLAIVFVLSSFLDNIAAALIGGAMAHSLFKRVHIGYLAAIVAASNAGGSFSVVGDTTTTMMWIDGVSPLDVLHASVAAIVALFVSGLVAAFQQHRHSPIIKDARHQPHIDWVRLAIVIGMLAAAVAANVVVNLRFPELADRFPFIGVAVWVVILISAPLRRPDWKLLREAGRGAVFLLSLVLAASMMPVETLPAASWQTTFGLGFVSAVFDNIPLTKLALVQGGYDWGVLAYAVGYGGSMIWFGSSAGVAITNLYPEARSVGAWVREGWHVAVAYVIGFFVMLTLLGWEPHEPHKLKVESWKLTVSVLSSVESCQLQLCEGAPRHRT
ncbi:MAG: citrate transporter [Acidobacteriota bacterium]|nr:citrate transporter [Acidobacteriota bacterium]